MLSLAIVFFVIAVVAYMVGARGLGGMSAGIGNALLFVFLVLAVVAVLAGVLSGRGLGFGF